MSITIRPKGEIKISGQQGDDQTFEYWVSGDNNYADVYMFCEISLDLWFNNKFRKGIDLEQVSPKGIFLARATYAQLKPEDPKFAEETGVVPFQFELSGEQQHLTQSLKTIKSYGRNPSDTPPDYKQAVKVTGKGKDRKIEGYDLEFPRFTWSEKYYLPTTLVFSKAYRQALKKAYNKTNKKKFRDDDPNSVLFLNATGGMSEKFPDYCEVTFRFESGDKATDLKFGDITGVEKGPFELLWVQYDTDTDSTAKMLVERPRYVFVEQVLGEIDFATLQLPIPS